MHTTMIMKNNSSFEACYHQHNILLMEGAIGERLKREYGIPFDSALGLAGHVYDGKARGAMAELYGQYLAIAQSVDLPIMITTPTRRANRERTALSLYKDRTIIQDNVAFLRQLKAGSGAAAYLGGLMGCRSDAYSASDVMTCGDAYEFHSWQAGLFAAAGVDFLYAGIMPALPEALGMARAMESTGLPYIISFMIRRDGRLLDGTAISDAIAAADSATARQPLCYMTNCVHPLVLRDALNQPFNQTEAVRLRFKGIQANTSPLPPEELDGCCELQTSDSLSLACDMEALYQDFRLKIFGGCCGTDRTHMEELAKRLKKYAG
jgi:S-methylmethionine-dependent homocysteine/selenocysteine methylase